MAQLTKALKKKGITKSMLQRAKREGGIALDSKNRQRGRNKGKKGRKADAATTALPPGKRLSRNGAIYYEYRRNRTDKSRKKRV